MSDTPDCFAAIDARVLVAHLQNAAIHGAANLKAIYTAAEQAEILQAEPGRRRQEKIAGKLAVKLIAANVLKHWFDETAALATLEVLSPGTPVQVGAPASSRAHALLKTLYFSLTHNDRFVCAAVGVEPVGIDVETIAPLTPAMMREIGVLPSLPEPLPLMAFTQKEAVLKAAAIGLEADLKTVALGAIGQGQLATATFLKTRYDVVSAIEQGCIVSLARRIPAPVSRSEAIPSTIQEVMWLMSQLDGFGATHNVSRTTRLRGPLNVKAFFRSVQHIVERHDVLRTVFRETEESCRCEVLSRVVIPIVFESFSHYSSEPALLRARQRCALELTKPFDLAHGPLVRCFLFEVGPDDHCLQFIFHHTIIDASSVDVFWHELSSCYRAFREGRSPVLPAMSWQYGDYAREQRLRLTPGRMDTLLEFWRASLAGAPARLELPLDHARPPYSTFGSDNVECELPGKLLHALRELRAAEKVSLFVVFLAAFEVFLARVSGQKDLVVGVPFVNRRDEKTQQLIGCFVNPLPIRAHLQESVRFRDFLAEAQASLKSAMAHHDLPFSVLVEKLAPHRRTACPPIFQAGIVLLREEVDGTELAGLTQEDHRGPAGGTTCDLNVYVAVAKDGGRVQFEFNRELFESSTIRRMAEQYMRLLEDIVANPDGAISTGFDPAGQGLQPAPASARDQRVRGCVIVGEGALATTRQDPSERTCCQPVGEVSLRTGAERELLLTKWNAGPVTSPPELCVHELFEQKAETSATTPAVVFDGASLTYQQLNEQSNRLAHYLRALGVLPESRIGVCIDRAPNMVVGLLATLKAGGAYVPLDPAYPAERLAFMLADSDPKAILTQKSLVASLPNHRLPVICLDDLPEEVARESAANPVSAVLPSNLAYVIYTSGSTGRPKGVLVEHRALANYTVAAIHKFGVGAGDRMLQFASINFDASAEEIYPCLAGGATLVLRTEEMIKTAATFFDLCRTWNVTLLDLPTAYWSHLVGQMEREDLSLPPAVRIVIIGGESALPVRVAAWHKRVQGSARLFNTYGPTETTIVATWCELADTPGSALPIGRPIPNAQVYVLDPALQPVPIGVAGELCIGGSGLARGYLNQPELTAERFIANPYDKAPNARLYRTGDVVRFLPDGNLEFMGRQDQQVKIRGYRVDLTEVETALALHPAIRENVVTVLDVGPDDRRLVAYAVPVDGSVLPDTEALRRFLKNTLPDYMIPGAFVMLDCLPVGHNGKIDRKALPAPASELFETACKSAAPRNVTEALLAAIWCEVVGLKRVGIHDNFFDRGGHSLLGVRLVTQIRSAFQCDLPLRSLFQAPTIAELAGLIQSGHCPDESKIHLVEVQKGRSGLPLFFVPGGGGGESQYMVYARMMRQLGHDLPVYGFRVWGLDGRTKPKNSVKALAFAFIAELITVQPQGPYFLAGECLGGILAYEMAQQLRARGARVAFLGMMDTSCPSMGSFLRNVAGKLRPHCDQFLGRILQLPWSRRLTGLPGAIATTMKQLGNDLGYVRSHPLEKTAPEQRRLQVRQVRYTYTRTLLRYQPKPYDGKITMLLTNDFKSVSGPPAAWRKWACGGLEVHRLEGNHKDYVRDQAVTTGRVFGQCLTRARQEAEARQDAREKTASESRLGLFSTGDGV